MKFIYYSFMSFCPFSTQQHYLITLSAHDIELAFLLFLTLQIIKFHSANSLIALQFVEWLRNRK
jgi:hypothetical protein